MKYNQLGRTGLFVSEICLGTMTFGRPPDSGVWKAAMGGVESQDAVDGILAHAIAAGVNFIDTADSYSAGESERMTGRGLKNLGVDRKDIVLATKVASPVGAKPNDRGASRGHIMDSVRGSLERLQTDYIDLYQIHAHDPVTSIDETLRALDDLIAMGLVRYIGVSNWSAWRIAKALGRSELKDYARFEAVQAYYSIAGRDLEREIVPLLREEQLGLMVWSPLAGGLLSGKFGPGAPPSDGGRRQSFDFPPVDKDRAWACVAVMREIGAARGASVARVALAWLLAQPHVMSLVVGAKTLAQLDDNLQAVDLALTPGDMRRLDEVSALPGEYPGWLLDIQGALRRPPPFAPNNS